MHIHAYTCVYAYTYLYMHIREYTHIHTDTCIYNHIHAYIHIHALTWALCIYMHIHAYTLIYIHIRCIHTYTDTIKSLSGGDFEGVQPTPSGVWMDANRLDLLWQAMQLDCSTQILHGRPLWGTRGPLQWPWTRAACWGAPNQVCTNWAEGWKKWMLRCPEVPWVWPADCHP